MKLIMTHTLLSCLLLSFCAMTLTSCETTGDPSQGGLFGWSQSKADVRIDQRRRELHHLEGDNYSQKQRSNSLQSERTRLSNQQ
ncbi:hypothetical protein [Prosthecobacter sp.]|uniref:hypothetical protein n=1 Tax=Prosthecobacter sp. TaxID=1965333 RepID=UPI002ABC4562|nr:hypothetical protein [Prosthecobacter sp.]MDZ4405008.1 hypothetical protein [Prosthecobacter sp.]